MPHLILFDNEVREQLLPFTYLRPICELRVGMLTIREKWERWMGGKVSWITQDYLSEKYPIEYGEENLIINGSVMPSEQLCTLLRQMEFNEALLSGEELIAAKLDNEQLHKLVNDEPFDDLKGFDLEDTEFLKLNWPWDIFAHNGAAIEADFHELVKDRTSQPLSDTNRVVGDPDKIFLEEGARVECASLNTEYGPIYLGRDAQVMEGCLIRGPFALGAGATLKMGAKIYGPTSIGALCKVGGEVKHSVIQDFSNKSHDGYLGNSVIGSWCNLGADTNCSNMKNTYAEVKVWSYPDRDYIPTGHQFCGLFMGDHCSSGINSMFNTGTVAGVSCNLFDGGFPSRFLPSFSWGGARGLTTYRPEKAFEAIERAYALKGKTFEVEDRLIILKVFEESARFRIWEQNEIPSDL